MLTDEIRHEIEEEVAIYPLRRAACIDALRIVQRHRGWVDDESVRDVADALGMTPDEVDSVATFYNLIHRRPTGRHVIRVCTSVSCYVMNGEGLAARLSAKLGIGLGQTTPDNRFTLVPNQCLGACDLAPAMLIDEDLYGKVDLDGIDAILERYT
jgi:NADH-quinone oxidoreductase subunit E